MNFFEQQAAARRASLRLMLLFALAVLCIVGVIGGLAWMLLPSWRLLAFCTGITVIVIGFGSLFRIASLSEGGAAIAQQLGGSLVQAETQDPALRRLRHVVEEMAIASGVPVPKIYVMEDEPGINAFAAGFTTSDAAVAVTRGALERLNRDELQGVIAHEFSHILNGDMRLNIRLIGVLFGILMIGLIGQKIFQYGRWGGRNDKGNGLLIVLALVAVVIGWLGQFFARLIKAGISRSRERLADASAVQFTRQTRGLAGALKKIAGLDEGSRLTHGDTAEEVSHMLFGDGVGFSRWFATHPPLLERIQILEPSFRHEHLQRLANQWRMQPPDGLQEDLALGLVDAQATRLPDAEHLLVVSPAQVAAQVAMPADNDVVQAETIVTALPDALRELARAREHAMPLVLALLLERDDDAILQAQQQVIEQRLGVEAASLAVRIHQQLVADLHPQLRLPLAALAFPVLRLRPRPQLETFMATMQAMVDADGRVSLFEYCLCKLLAVQVREALNPARYARFGRRKAVAVQHECSTLLAVVAQYGNRDTASAKRAYLAGLQRVLPHNHIPYQPPIQGVRALDAVWEPLDALDPMAKQLLVEAVTDAISSDGKVTVAEAELLRMICGVLHCPLPAMLST